MTIANTAVLVTGANGGIGQALVEEALSRGAKRVCAAARQPTAHPEDERRALTPLFWSNINLYGRFRLYMDTRLDLSAEGPAMQHRESVL